MGNLKLTLFLAYKSIIKGNRWALFLIVVVVALSFVNLIITPSILSGVTNTLDEQQVKSLFGNIVVDPPSDEYYLEHAGQIEEKIAQVPGVTGVASHLDSSAYFEYQWREKTLPSDKGKSGNWRVIGINPAQEANVTEIHNRLIEGSYLDNGDRDKIVLGIEIAGSPGAQTAPFLTLGEVRVGDKVRLTYPNGVQREYLVKGIYQAKEITQADHLAFVTRDEMVSVLGRGAFADRASQVLASLQPGSNEHTIIQEFKTLGINGQIRSWRDYGGALGGIVSSFNVLASLINAIGLVVAAIVMFIMIYINVLNKRRQIGILRAIGIKGNVLISSYLVQALFYAVAGIAIGWLLVHFAVQPYFINHPLNLPLGPVSLGIGTSMVINAVWGLVLAAIFAGVIPVLAIIRQTIIRAIWGS